MTQVFFLILFVFFLFGIFTAVRELNSLLAVFGLLQLRDDLIASRLHPIGQRQIVGRRHFGRFDRSPGFNGHRLLSLSVVGTRWSVLAGRWSL